MAQPATEEIIIASTTHDVSSDTMRLIAGVLSAAGIVALAIDLLTAQLLLPPVLMGLIFAVPIVAWSIYRSTRAEERVCRKIGCVADMLAAERRDGFAEGYVAGLRRDPLPKERYLRSM